MPLEVPMANCLTVCVRRRVGGRSVLCVVCVKEPSVTPAFTMGVVHRANRDGTDRGEVYVGIAS